MEDEFFVESVYRRFDAAIDRIDTRERSPTPHEADVLTQAWPSMDQFPRMPRRNGHPRQVVE